MLKSLRVLFHDLKDVGISVFRCSWLNGCLSFCCDFDCECDGGERVPQRIWTVARLDRNWIAHVKAYPCVCFQQFFNIFSSVSLFTMESLGNDAKIQNKGASSADYFILHVSLIPKLSDVLYLQIYAYCYAFIVINSFLHVDDHKLLICFSSFISSMDRRK